MTRPFDLFIFGSTSEFVQALIARHKPWFREHVHKLHVSQRADACPDVYRDFDVTSTALDCSDPHRFREGLQALVAAHATRERPMHVLSTYGRFSWDYAAKDPVFRFSDDGLQINLTSRLQIIDAFREYADNTRFHLFGSLFANFPYTGDYALSMWYVNRLPRNPEYRDLNLIVYNLGGMKTRFWRHADGPQRNPFLHDELPTEDVFRAGFLGDRRGVVTFYPSAVARFACFLGRMGVRVL
ncbi:MAG: hypothetical protein R3A51_06850 [Nannocystaceae bacterium]|nr:hypothetical protein [Myxococcales bacterium]